MRLSDAAFLKLSIELSRLLDEQLPAALALVNDSRTAGDISQNSDYFVAADAEAQVRVRVRRIEAVLAAHAKAVESGEAVSGVDVVRAGVVVTVDFGGNDLAKYLFGSIEEAGVADVDVVTLDSPMGKAVLGAAVGDSVCWAAHAGMVVSASITDIALP